MHFTRARLDTQRSRREEVVGTMHAALRRRLLVLLNCHDYSRKILRILTQAQFRVREGTAGPSGQCLATPPHQCFLSSGSLFLSFSSTANGFGFSTSFSPPSAASSSSPPESRLSCTLGQTLCFGTSGNDNNN